jgi:glycosyltransferase involved in cell wall biosynthesis
VRICLVYDHLFPQTIGGAERWMRDLSLHLAKSQHEVTYLTMRHWDGGSAPSLQGVRVLGVADAGRIYEDERRTLGPPLRFGLAVARHLARHGKRYDVVHVASFPFFPVLAAAALRRRSGYRLVVDWHEVWTRSYWRHYAGLVTGTIGWLVQRACIRVQQRAYCMSRMNARRLVAEGFDGEPIVLPGIYAGPARPTASGQVDPALVVYAGRHVREKRVGELVRAFARAREQRPELRLELYGNGPERGRVETLVQDLGLGHVVRSAGHRPEEEVGAALSRAACLATASEREGYGLVVVEAAARGTPSVIVAGPENGAVELVSEGANGAVAASAEPEELASAILRVLQAGPMLRRSTTRWFEEHASRLRIDASLHLVSEGYEQT